MNARSFTARGVPELQRMADVIRGLDAGKPWKIEVSEYRSRRSGDQNRMLWAIYTTMADGTGHTPEEIHEAMKAKFLPRRVVTVGNEELVVSGSSAQLDVAEFSDFVENVRMFAAQELGLVL